MSKHRLIALFTLLATHAAGLLPGILLAACAQPRLPHQIVGSSLIAQSSSTLVEAVDRIAQTITVRISSLSSGYGSGVLVAKQGSTYFVLTAEHVVPKPDSYTILTPDGQSHPVIGQKITKLEGIDLALLQFSSPQAYQIATLANYYVGPELRPLAFLSGFPGASATASHQLTVGTVFPSTATLFAAQSAYSTASGRELVYTAFSQPGMSGGPILDTQGRVIGIHNASETKLEADAATGEVVPIYLGRSLGVPISTFLGRVTQAQVDPTLLKLDNASPPSLPQATLRAVLDDRLPPQPSGNVSPSAWLAYGNRLWRLGRFKEAQQALEQALQMKPDFYQALYVKGLTLLSQDKFSEAIATFDATLQIEPRFYEALRMKAQMLERLKRYSEALATIEQAIQIEPKDPLLYSLKGDFLYQLQQYGAATSAYTQALDLKPAYYIYMQRGRSRFSEGNYQGAYSDYDRAIAQQPNDYFSYMARGTMNSVLGKSQEALEDFQQALQSIPVASPYKSVLYLSRGLEYFSRRNLEAAIADWTMALNTSIHGSTSPDIMAQIYTSRALAYSQSKDLPKAIADMGKLIDIQPRNATAFYNRGDFYLQAGDPQRAMLDLNQAIALQPNNAEAIQARGVAKQALKDFAGAASDFKQAVDLLNVTIAQAPNNINTANAYIRRANARLGLGNKQGAIEDIQVVVQLLQQAGMTQGVMYQTVQKMLTLLQP